ncbi:MAG: urease accessory protein UreD [Gammaproteobacteria bacterium]|nr:urease accessory protein UreD [Gammaproteobacteria bacterium]
MNAAIPSTTNWQALLQLSLRYAEDKTRLIPLRRYGPLSVQRPFYPEREVCHVYLLHPPGGVVGGDQLDLQIELEARAKALFTTPGANKFYLSAGEYARVEQQIKLQDQAQLEFLPQENIYFPGALVKAKTSLSLAPNSSAIVWEKHCFGRPANQEFFASGQVITELEVRIDEQPVFIEKQRIDAAEIRRASGLRHHPVSGSLLVYSQSLNKPLLEALRAVEPRQGISGLTQPLDSLLVVRYMGSSTADLNTYFIRLLELLRPALLDRKLCRPRIWNT